MLMRSRANWGGMSTPMPVMVDQPVDEDLADPDSPWIVVLWNDPINTVQYVIYVLQKVFGYERTKAVDLTNEVDAKGKAAVSSGSRERAEVEVFQLHEHGLWATIEQG